jgi:hypothetical protein
LLDNKGMTMKLVYMIHESFTVKVLALTSGIVSAKVDFLLKATINVAERYREREMKIFVNQQLGLTASSSFRRGWF